MLSSAAPKHPGSLFRKARDVDMTEGNIALHLIRFAVPLLIGNIFQQLYNTVDTWVVGNYVSNEAFSAVGSVGPVTNLLIGFFSGLATGTGVVISQYYGARKEREVRSTVHTALVMTLVLGVLFTALGLFLTPVMLRFMNTPDNVFPQSSAYLHIYFAGILTLMIYNMGAGILRAVGDSVHPFYFLVICALINTVLDLFFVLVLHMGVEGVALATVAAQGVSAILILITLMRNRGWVQLRPSLLKIDWFMLRKIIRVGIPSAIQMAITSFSNIYVQSYINFFGDNCMAGWTAYSKIDQLMALPIQSMSMAASTFVGQNLGRSQVDRARQGVSRAMLLASSAVIAIMIPLMVFAQPIVSFFNSKPEVVRSGSQMILWLSPFYLLSTYNQIHVGSLRGSGNAKAPTIILLASMVVFRQVYLLIMSRVWNEMIPIAMSYPAGWLAGTTLIAIYYHRAQFGRNSLIESGSKAI